MNPRFAAISQRSCRLELLGLWALVALLTVVGVAEDSASTQELPAGWTATTPPSGRVGAALHEEGRGRMVAWKLTVPNSELDGFRARMGEGLKLRGFASVDAEEANLDGYPATLARYELDVDGRAFHLLVLEVYRRGVLWQFTATYGPSDVLSPARVEADLQRFAESHLAS